MTIDLACIHRPQNGEPARQDLEFELIVSYARRRGLSTLTVGYSDRGASVDGIPEALAQRPALVYWHLPSRGDLDWFRQSEIEGPRDAPEVVGGDFAARRGRSLLEKLMRFDGLIRLHPEHTLAAVAEACRRGDDWKCEAGLTVRRGDGTVVVNPPRPMPDDLDSLGCNADDFSSPDRIETGHRVMTSRGCNSDCRYCGLQTPYLNEYGPESTTFWRGRSPEGVLAEIESFRARGVRRFYFNSFVVLGYDASGSRQVEAIARGILDRGLDIDFQFVTLVRDLHRNLGALPLLRQAGLAQVTVGIDSGLPRALDLYQVGHTPEQAVECLRVLSEEGIPFFSSFIFYDPYLSLQEVRENLCFLDRLRPCYSHMQMPFSYFLDQQLLGNVLRVRCDTPLYERLLADGLTERVDPLEREPRVGMRHPAAGRLFQTHQAVSRTILPSLRPLLFNTAAVDRYGDTLEMLPRDLVERLVELFESVPETDPREAMSIAAGWLHARLSDSWKGMVGLLDLEREDHHRLSHFLDNLGRHGQAA